MDRRYLITEVFAEGPYSGNQLATVIDCEGLSTFEMQQIARAFNFAETTFVLGGDEQNGSDIRIFTPQTELPFAGHPTLGTSYLLRHHIEGFETPELTLNLGVGPIKVWFQDDGVIWMRQNEPSFGATAAASEAAALIELAENDLDDRFPVQAVSTGLEFLLVPVRDLETLRKGRVVPTGSDVGILAFCGEGYRSEHAYASRMFAPGLGVGEDAATGSATGCLAAYLAEYEYSGSSKVSGTVGQGFEIGRPSALHLAAEKTADEFVVEVGGRVNLVAEGVWRL